MNNNILRGSVKRAIRFQQSFRCYSRSARSASPAGSSITPLHYEWIQPSGESQIDSPIVFLHGLLGNGRNVKTMATKICQSKERPWILIDLPGHGQSKGRFRDALDGTDDSSSKISNTRLTFDDAVKDIQETIVAAIAAESLCAGVFSSESSNISMIGHSLGGRITLHYLLKELHPKPDHVWLLDTVPGKVEPSVHHVLRTAVKIVEEFKSEDQPISRKDLTSKLTEEPHKLSLPTSQWLASSYDAKTREFGFDLQIAEGFVEEIHERCFLDMSRKLINRQNVSIHLVQGGKNPAWESSGSLGAIQSLTKSKYFTHHVLPEAGHLVHIDDLPGLLQGVDSVEMKRSENAIDSVESNLSENAVSSV